MDVFVDAIAVSADGSTVALAPVFTLERDGTGLVRLADATYGADFRPLP